MGEVVQHKISISLVIGFIFQHKLVRASFIAEKAEKPEFRVCLLHLAQKLFSVRNPKQ